MYGAGKESIAPARIYLLRLLGASTCVSSLLSNSFTSTLFLIILFALTNVIPNKMVRVRRVELLSQPWEGHIIAVIRYPHISIRQTYGFSHRAGKMVHILAGCSFPCPGPRVNPTKCLTNESNKQGGSTVGLGPTETNC